MTIDEKMDYWTKMINKHDHKAHEVDCIISIRNYLYSHLGNDFYNIEPEFQACVRRPNGKHALIDLYFPFCNIGIEVDEAGHIGQELKDLEREVDIIEQLKALGRPDYKVIHINCHDGWKTKWNEIEKAAWTIATAYINAEEKPVWDNISGYDFYKEKTSISSKDMFVFQNMSDAANTILRTYHYGNNHGMMQCFPCNHISKDWNYVFTSFFKDREWVRKHSNEFYYNDFAPDMSEIKMYSDVFQNNDKKRRAVARLVKLKDKTRIVFCKNKEGETVFCGLYKFNGLKSCPETMGCKFYEHYVKISDEYIFQENIFTP